MKVKLLGLILFLILFASPVTAGHEECEYFGNGTFVGSKLSGLKGMVVAHYRTEAEEFTARGCRFDVRFVTETGWVYTIEKMRPYELEEYTPRPQPAVIAPASPTENPVKDLDFGG